MKALCFFRLAAYHTDVVNDPHISDELMYGRSGYLYSLLFVQTHIGPDAIEDYIVDKVFNDKCYLCG